MLLTLVGIVFGLLIIAIVVGLVKLLERSQAAAEQERASGGGEAPRAGARAAG